MNIILIEHLNIVKAAPSGHSTTTALTANRGHAGLIAHHTPLTTLQVSQEVVLADVTLQTR